MDSFGKHRAFSFRLIMFTSLILFLIIIRVLTIHQGLPDIDRVTEEDIAKAESGFTAKSGSE